MPDNLSTHANPVKFVAATVAAAALTMLLSGCARDTSAGGELLRSEAEPRATSRILLAQTVTGAGEDAMLYQHHFDGVELNSLGMAKLRLMLEDAGFLANPEIFVVEGRTEQLAAVGRYLGEWGVAFEDTRIVAGPNPATRRPAAIGLAERQKFEEGLGSGGSGGGGGATGSATGAGAAN
jgi:hypothetical protein